MNIRIFFSSPGDVKMERETAKRIVEPSTRQAMKRKPCHFTLEKHPALAPEVSE